MGISEIEQQWLLRKPFLNIAAFIVFMNIDSGSQILKDPLPNHIAIILDGNRRWAKYHFAGRYKGHSIGADKAEEL